MSTKGKKILITSETHETLIVRQGGHAAQLAFCDQCGSETEMLTLDAASAVSGIRTRAIIGLVETGRLHGQETAAGAVRICVTSLIDVSNGNRGEKNESS